jgi:hypothetical protein
MAGPYSWSSEVAPPDLVLALPGGLGRLDPQLVTRLPLALLILAHGQMRLIQPRIAAYHQAGNLLPARIRE